MGMVVIVVMMIIICIFFVVHCKLPIFKDNSAVISMHCSSDPNGVYWMFHIIIIFFHELVSSLFSPKMSLEQASSSYEKKKEKKKCPSSYTINDNFQVRHRPCNNGIKMCFFIYLPKLS